MQQTQDASITGIPLHCRERPSSRTLPLGICDDDAVPLFSPNQVSAQEKVLHSIFSPYSVPSTEIAGSDANDSLGKHPESKPHDWSGAQDRKVAPKIHIPPSIPNNGLESFGHGHSSPYSVKGVLSRHPAAAKSIQYAVAKSNSFESSTSVDNAWFVLSTPAGGRQAMYFASPISEISALSDRSFKSFLEIPNIEMLSFDFVKQCTSPELLQKIISILTREDKFPGLLRAARQRWNAIGIHDDNNSTPVTSLPILPPKSKMLMLGWNSTQQNERRHANDSTLVMSLSDSSCLAGEGLSEKTETSPNDAVSESLSQSGTPSDAKPSLNVAQPATKTVVNVDHDSMLGYTQRVDADHHNTFTRGPDVSSHALQFARLTKAKEEAERRIKRLEEVASKSTNRTRELTLLIDSLKKQNQQLQQRSKDDKAARDRAIKEANSMKDRFQRVLKELNDRLTQATEQERQLQAHQRSKAELNSMLKESVQQYAVLKREQDMMIAKLAKSINRKDWKNVEDQERRTIVDDAIKKITSGNLAAKALTEAFESAEDDRRKVEQDLEKSKEQLQNSVSSLRRLERENHHLTQNIQSLSAELASKNEQIEKMIQSVRNQQRKEWAAQELHYQKIVKHLQQQLRSEQPTVPTKLYEAKVNEVRQRETECHDKQRQIKALAEKVTSLETKLQAITKPPPPPPPLSRPKPVLTVVTNTASGVAQNGSKENAAPPKGAAKPVSVSSSQPCCPKQSARTAIVQRAGGRKALFAQVKQMRSPKFATAV